jgi:iron complex transport system ATP-binding protein
MLQVENLRFAYVSDQPVLKDVTFDFNNRDVLCVLGPNGTGKTTLLRCLLGLARASGGRITLDGKDLTTAPARVRASYMAYVPQASTIAFPYEAEEIVLMGRIAHLKLGGSPSKNDKAVCRKAMESLGISHLRRKMFNQLSGGERQLVLVARAMSQQARILAMDEPTANLDYGNQARILRLIHHLAEEGYSILLVTHFPDHAFLACTQAVLMKDGVVKARGSPETVITSDSLTGLYETEVCVTETTLCDCGLTAKVCVPLVNNGNNRREER